MGSVARMKFLGLVIGLSLYLSACGGGGGSSNGPGGTTQPTLSSITVTPATVALIAGQTQQLTATANYSDGSTKDVTSTATWSSSNAAVVTVSASGLVTSVAAGQVSITATLSGVSKSDAITVNAKTLTSISVTPATVTLIVGQTHQLTATGTYNDGSTTNVTPSANWSSSNSAVATVSASGLVTSVTAGQANISAALSGISGSDGITVSSPAPTVAITVTPSMVVPGGSSSLTWSSSNASACTASGAWAGNQSTSGTLAVSETTIGNYLYTLSCTGAGGTTTASASLLVTNLKASSYENKNHIGAVPVSFPGLNALNAFAIADFFQDGTKSVVLHTLEYSPGNPSTYQNFGHIHFYRQDQTGAWVDDTSTLLASTTGCLHPRKAVVADFNRDGKPDVYFACHGADAPPFPGEQPHVLLSQPNGTYTNTIIPITCYCHGASAADINGDGYPDVLVTDNIVAQTPFFLMNNGDGTFTPDYSRLPSTLKNMQIFSAELIDFNGSGKYDVFLAGNEPGTTNYPPLEFGPAILPNDGSGKFSSTTPVNLLVGSSYGLALDILYQNGFVYLLKVNNAYTSSEIQKIAYPALQASTIYTHSGAYPNGSTWLDWILPYNQQIVGEDASYGVTVPQ
jgi:uncharacterized protein YjdB